MIRWAPPVPVPAAATARRPRCRGRGRRLLRKSAARMTAPSREEVGGRGAALGRRGAAQRAPRVQTHDA